MDRKKKVADCIIEKKPKLVYIVTSAVSANVLLRGQLRALASAGFDVTVITSPDLDLEAIARREGVRARAVTMEREMNPFKDLAALWQLYRILREIRPAIVNASTPKAGLLGMIAATMIGIPVRIYQLRGLRLETARGWQQRVLILTEWLASHLAHRVVCNSFSLRDAVLERRLASPDRVTVLGAGSSNGVDIRRFHPPSSADRESQNHLRHELGFAAHHVVIGFVGRLTKDKGAFDLLAVFDHLLPAFPDIRLLFVGGFERGDPLPAEVVERIKSDDRIIVTGFVDDTAPYYRIMDLFAFPSYREGFPNAPLEAAASGVPAVGFRATGTVDAIVDGKTGCLVEIADIYGMADIISRLIADPVLAQEISAEARRHAVTSYDARKVWKLWADFYLECLAEHVPATR